jgi:4-amino-4-deoxy-L-arabinose transferase-like glycosyltransferase
VAGRRNRAVDSTSLPFHRLKAYGPLLLVLLIGAALRIGLLGNDQRFHPDEALFAAQARLVSHDWLLRNTDLDKPPLTLFVTALSFRVLGTTETAARLPNVFFSALSLILLYDLARQLYRDRVVAILAALLVALSPYDLAFAATVFTDVQATFWVLAACVLAVRDRWVYAGAAAALVFACKPNALLFVPLIAALGMAQNARPNWRSRDVTRRLAQLVIPLAFGIGLLVLWDAARAPRSFLSLGYTRNNPGRLIRADEVWPRLEQWGHWLGFITGSPVLNVFLPVGGLMLLAWDVKQGRSRAALADWMIAGFGIAFLAWHWLIAFNAYDRYLHTLVPFVLLLAARVCAGVWRMTGTRRLILAGIAGLLVLLVLPGTIQAERGQAALGGDQGTHRGIDRLAHYLNTRLRGETVYDHWLGWELAYYLGESPSVSIVYMPLPEALVEEMAGKAGPRYLVAPSAQQAAFWIDQCRQAGIAIQVVYDDPPFVVYRLGAG